MKITAKAVFEYVEHSIIPTGAQKEYNLLELDTYEGDTSYELGGEIDAGVPLFKTIADFTKYGLTIEYGDVLIVDKGVIVDPLETVIYDYETGWRIEEGMIELEHNSWNFTIRLYFNMGDDWGSPSYQLKEGAVYYKTNQAEGNLHTIPRILSMGTGTDSTKELTKRLDKLYYKQEPKEVTVDFWNSDYSIESDIKYNVIIREELYAEIGYGEKIDISKIKNLNVGEIPIIEEYEFAEGTYDVSYMLGPLASEGAFATKTSHYDIKGNEYIVILFFNVDLYNESTGNELVVEVNYTTGDTISPEGVELVIEYDIQVLNIINIEDVMEESEEPKLITGKALKEIIEHIINNQ